MLCSIFISNLEKAAKHHCLVSILSQAKIGMVICMLQWELDKSLYMKILHTREGGLRVDMRLN